MDINLRWPSGDRDRDDRTIASEDVLAVNALHSQDTTLGSGVVNATEVGGVDSPIDVVVLTDTYLEPLSGMEFESHGAAYSFYQEYARSVGFNTAIQNSRRSKTSREFIDAKFACSRYGTKREYDKPFDRPRVRQIKQDLDNETGRRACPKTDCKASMHVKRRHDGKWIIHSFIKEHNHELLPPQAVSEQTRKLYAAMARQFAEYKTVVGLANCSKPLFVNGHNPGLPSNDVKSLLSFFIEMQNMNSNFFYAIDLDNDLRLKSVIWVDAKSRHDYSYFSDVASLDTTYLRNKYKMPLVIFVGVNQHYQFMLLGCALLSDESGETYSWLFEAWTKAMGGKTPRTIITEKDNTLKSTVARHFPNSSHYFFLWSIVGKYSENLAGVINLEDFMRKFEKCIFRSTENEFENRWLKIIDRFGLQENKWMMSLYEDRVYWVPVYAKDVCLAGMSTPQRSESVNSYFDKFVHRKTTITDLVKHYHTILQDRYEGELKVEIDTWNKQPMLKSPSPLEKSVAGLYTHMTFKKFQAEVLGVVACHPKVQSQGETTITFKVQDLEKQQDFIVLWNQVMLEVSCLCRLFEYGGYLCRHALVVLQMCQQSSIPSKYVLKRWTKNAKNRSASEYDSDQVLSRLERYNNLCQRAMRLCEEGSLSQGSYRVMVHAIEEAFDTCVSFNNSNKTLPEASSTPQHCVLCAGEDDQSRNINKEHMKKNLIKKRKDFSEQEVAAISEHENLQPMEKVGSRLVTLDGYCGLQTNVPGMVQLNLMAPSRDSYYASHQSIQGLGQLNAIGPCHDGYYGSQQGIHGLGHMDFFRAQTAFPYCIRDDPNMRTQLHNDSATHP